MNIEKRKVILLSVFFLNLKLNKISFKSKLVNSIINNFDSLTNNVVPKMKN